MTIDPNVIIAVAAPFLAPLATALVKWLLPKLPPWSIPMICTALGTLGAYFAQWALSADMSIGVAIGLGLAGIGVREIKDQLTPYGTVKEAQATLAEAKADVAETKERLEK